MNVLKLARRMEAWRVGHHRLPQDVIQWMVDLPGGRFAVVSPRAGTAHGLGSKAGTVAENGWWIIRAETGCLYAVSDTEFRKKYRPIEDETPAPASPLNVHMCWPAQQPTQH